MYESKQGANSGIASCQSKSGDDSQYCRTTSTSGEPYFVPTAATNQVNGPSEMYSSTQARDNGIEACKKVGPAAPTVGLSLRILGQAHQYGIYAAISGPEASTPTASYMGPRCAERAVVIGPLLARTSR
jgi:uncharacterized protein YegP (UPF0339 family)